MMAMSAGAQDAFYENYYLRQVGGGGLPVYQAPYFQKGYGIRYQRGHGLGGILGGLFRSALPVLKQGAKAVGNELLKGGIGVINDVAQGKNAKQAVKARLKTAGRTLFKKGVNRAASAIDSAFGPNQSGGGRATPVKRIRGSQPAHRPKKKRKQGRSQPNDIFG